MIYQIQGRKRCRLRLAGSCLLVFIYSLLFCTAYGQQGERPRQLIQPEDTPSRQDAQGRVALVIGNGNYRNASPLPNPPNDARDMAATLHSLGFEVLEGVDQTAEEMVKLIRRFGERLKQKGGVGLFYYAGHGVQVGGKNYLIPVEVNSLREQTIEDEAVDVGRVLREMDAAGNDLNIVVLDACRSNPFARGWRGSENGLAEVRAPAGTLIAYATSPDTVADDGAGRNGVYTAELLKQLIVPGQTVEAMFKAVRTLVAASTKKRQIPWESTSLFRDFYFAGRTGNNGGTTTGGTAPRFDAVKGAPPSARGPERPANTYPQAFVASYPPGALITTVGIPDEVSRILKNTKGVNHISLGGEGAWVVAESNGSNSFSGPTEFQASMAALSSPLNVIAFAPNGGWVIVQGTNGFITNNVPQDLINVLRATNQRKKAILDIDFHPKGGWVVVAEDMTTSSGIPADADRILMEVTKNGGVSKVAFSSTGWVIIPQTGGYYTSNIPVELSSALQETGWQGRRVHDIQLTKDGDGWVLITAAVKKRGRK